jgi:hypothetical protein
MRERAIAEKRPPRYEGVWRDREPGPEQEVPALRHPPARPARR